MNRKLVLLMTWVIVLIDMLVPATVSAEISVNVKAGDWIEYKITYAATFPPPEKYQTWITIEILSVQETSVTLNSTVKYSDGTQETEKLTIDIEMESASFGFFIIPANLENGDTFYSGDEDIGYITISEVEERTYASGRRTVVYATISKDGVTTTFYWDKTTGVALEITKPRADYTINAKADKTNMWQAQPFRLPIDPTSLNILIIVAIAIVATVAFLVIRRRRNRRRRRRRKLQKK